MKKFILALDQGTTSDWKYAWVPIVGPMLGAISAAGLFLILKSLWRKSFQSFSYDQITLVTKTLETL